jgi:hypothetical protein
LLRCTHCCTQRLWWHQQQGYLRWTCKHHTYCWPIKMLCCWVLPAVQLTLGTVDAAYSGDWSRIGAISKGRLQPHKLCPQSGMHLHTCVQTVSQQLPMCCTAPAAHVLAAYIRFAAASC